MPPSIALPAETTPAAARASARRRVALVGNPNVGKSVVFAALTGRYATVSNYPGTTVDVMRGRARGDAALEIVDTPGVNGLLPSSDDERVTRDILLHGVDGVIQVADAKNLPRALVVTLQLAEAGVPLVLALNMLDEAADRGVRVDVPALAAALGVPVVATVAVSGRGLGALARAVPVRPRVPRVAYPEAVERAVARVEPLLGGFPLAARALALMCVAGDRSLAPWLGHALLPAARAAVEDAHRAVRTALAEPVAYALTRARVRVAERVARSVTQTRDDEDAPAADPTRRCRLAGALAVAAWAALVAGDLGAWPAGAAGAVRVAAWGALGAVGVAFLRSAAFRAAFGGWASRRGPGLAVLGVVLYVVYRFVGGFAAGTAVDFLEDRVFGAVVNPAATWAVDAALGTAAGSGGAGGLVRDALVGPYGMVTVALTYAFAIILPIVTAFFLVFSLLEDSGYLPRLAVTANRTFRAMGLNGRAVLPMLLGFGCDTMATLTARVMETPKERLLVTLLLALGIPCSAQLGVILGLLGALPAWAPAVWAGVVAGVLFTVGLVAARVLPGERSDLVLELPPIRRPHLANVVQKTVARLEWYLREAVPVFVLGTLVLFALDATGVLARLVRLGEPVVVGLLGLPPRAAEAFLVGFFRRDYGSAGIWALFQQGRLAPVQAVVALVTITLFVPCVANFFVIVKERGLRTALAIAGFIFPFAFLVGGGLNLALRGAGLR
jgi:ferrous iron transport protein B